MHERKSLVRNIADVMGWPETTDMLSIVSGLTFNYSLTAHFSVLVIMRLWYRRSRLSYRKLHQYWGNGDLYSEIYLWWVIPSALSATRSTWINMINLCNISRYSKLCYSIFADCYCREWTVISWKIERVWYFSLNQVFMLKWALSKT